MKFIIIILFHFWKGIVKVPLISQSDSTHKNVKLFAATQTYHRRENLYTMKNMFSVSKVDTSRSQFQTKPPTQKKKEKKKKKIKYK